MGLFDALFGNRNQIPTVTTILPDAARQEIIAGRLPILNTDKLFLKRGEKIHFIDKAINMEQKTVKEFRHVGGSAPGLFEGTRWSSGSGTYRTCAAPGNLIHNKSEDCVSGNGMGI